MIQKTEEWKVIKLSRKEETSIQNENRLRILSNSIKYNNIHIIVIPEEEEREKGAKIYLKK